MKEVRLVSVAGASAVLYTAGAVVAIFLFADIGLLDAEKSTDILPIFVEHQTSAVVAGWLLVLAPVFLAVAGLGFLEAFRRAGSLIWVAALTFIGGSFLALIRNIIWLAMIYKLAPAYANATEGVQSVLATVGDTLLLFGFITGDLVGGLLIAGLGVPLFSAAMLRTKAAPRWVAWLGFAVALTGWFMLLMPLAEEFGIVAFVVGFPGFMVWMAAAGIILWRLPKSVAG